MLTPLDFLGWFPVDKNVADALSKHKKLVVMFSHTSAFDTILALQYTVFDDNVKSHREKFRFIVWDESYKNPIHHIIYKKLNAIPVPRSDIKEGGTSKVIYEELDKLDEFILLISPKGSCSKKDWRSGWYHIAKRYDASLVVLGPDYESHKMAVSGDPVKIEGRSYEEMESLLKPRFGEIVPLYPENEIVEIKPHGKTTVFNPGNKYAILCIIILLLLILFIFAFMPRIPDKVNKYVYEYTDKITYGVKGVTDVTK